MGNKTHPVGFRLGIVKDWQATWFARKQADYRKLVLEDLAIRSRISKGYPDAGISWVDIERSSSDVIVTIHTARPGIVIGRGGQRVEELRKEKARLTSEVEVLGKEKARLTRETEHPAEIGHAEAAPRRSPTRSLLPEVEVRHDERTSRGCAV